MCAHCTGETILPSVDRVVIVWAIGLLVFRLFYPRPVAIFWETHFMKTG